MSRWSMRWGAVLGGLVIALSGARVARAADAPAPTPAPAAAPAPATPAAAVSPDPAATADAEAKKKAADEEEKKKKQAEEEAAKAKLQQATSPAAAAQAAAAAGAAATPPAAPAAATPAAATAAAPATAAPAVATPADVPAAATPASAAPASAGTGVIATAPAPEPKKDEEKPLYFQGLGMDVSLADSSGLYAGEGVYENTWSLALLPSWKAGQRFFKDKAPLKGLTVSGRFILSGEFAGTADIYRTGNVSSTSGNYAGCDTSSISTQGGVADTSNVPYCQQGSSRRMDYSDIVLKATDPVYQIPKALIDIKGSLATALPTSAESRAASFATSFQPGVGISRSFFDKKLTVGYDFAFTKYFYSSNLPVYDQTTGAFSDPHNLALGNNATSVGGLEYFAQGGGYNKSFSLAHGVSVTYVPNDKFTFLGRYAIADAFKHSFDGCNVNLPNNPQLGAIDTCQSGAAVAAASGATLLTRGDAGVQQFSLAADYQIIDYLAAEVALVTETPQRHPDGSWQQPFLTTDYKNYSSFNFSVTLTTEALAAKLLHKS